jgi:hypothetical protein
MDYRNVFNPGFEGEMSKADRAAFTKRRLLMIVAFVLAIVAAAIFVA